jgi:hypothetical protein
MTGPLGSSVVLEWGKGESWRLGTMERSQVEEVRGNRKREEDGGEEWDEVITIQTVTMTITTVSA